MTMTVNMHMKDWSETMNEALWAYTITWKNIIAFSPYQIVYGK